MATTKRELTEEEKATLRARLAAGRAKREAAPSEEPRDYPDDDTWSYLAHKLGVRLPQKATKLTTGAMEGWLRKLGKTTAEYRESVGGQSFKQFIEVNPDWTQRAWAGLILEWIHCSAPCTYGAWCKIHGTRRDEEEAA